MKKILFIGVMAVIVAVAMVAGYATAVLRFSGQVDELTGEAKDALTQVKGYLGSRLTAEEKSFVGSWQLVANTTNGSRIIRNTTFNYDGTYSNSQFVDNNSSGTWCLRKHTLLFSRQQEGSFIDHPDDGGEVYWWTMLQPTANPNIYTVTSMGWLYSEGKTDIWEMNQTGGIWTMSRIGAS